MPTIAFLPWFAVEDEIAVEDLALLRYERSRRPFGTGSAEQRLADAILGHYFTHTERVVDAATLISPRAREPLADLSESEVGMAFEVGQCLSVAGLAERAFFQQLGPYCNSDTFQMIVQRFIDPPRGVALTTRRRDGETLNYVTGDAHRVVRPDHVGHAFGLLRPNIRLLTALIACRSTPAWPRVRESVFLFNLANTDRSEMAPAVEAVLTVSAFERLLDCNHGKEDELAVRVAETLQPSEEIPLDRCLRFQTRQAIERFVKATSVREAWVRDIFRTRGGPAHGNLGQTYPAVWSVAEHLLLGSFAFPLLVKSVLHEWGSYQFDSEDRLRIDAFEALASVDSLQREDSADAAQPWPWNRILGGRRLNDLLG